MRRHPRHLRATRWPLLILSAALALSAPQAPARAEVGEIRIAQQYGISYLPFAVMRARGLLEATAEKQGLPRPKVIWVDLSGGPAMNDGLLTGSLDFVSGGVSPLITIWAKTRDSLKVRAVAALSSFPLYLTSNNPKVVKLGDLGDEDRIALPAVKVSIQAVVLQMAAEQAFGEGHQSQLDSLTVSMAHPDATAALLGGRSEVTTSFTASPYQEQQLNDPKIHKVLSSYDVLGGPHTFNVVYTTGRFHDENPKTILAFREALDQADALIKASPGEAADIYIAEEHSKLPRELVERLITDPEHVFTTEPQQIMKIADFMYRIGQVKVAAAKWTDLFFPEAATRSGS
jgi:NitT/TauT family transport system substrate-binding protein